MALQTIRLLGGTTAQLNAETGPARAVALDITLWQLRVFDGSTPGGYVIGTGGGAGTDADLEMTATLSFLAPDGDSQQAFNVAVDEAFGIGPAISNNQVSAISNAGVPTATSLEKGVHWTIAAPDGQTLPATGTMTMIGPNTAWTGQGVRRFSIGGTVNIQIFEGGAAINGFASPIGITTTAATTTTTEAVAALAALRLDWSGGSAGLTAICAHMFGTKVIA